MIWDEFLRHFRFCDEEDSGLSDEEQERKGPKNRPKHTRKRIHQAKKNFLEKFKTASKYHNISCRGVSHTPECANLSAWMYSGRKNLPLLVYSLPNNPLSSLSKSESMGCVRLNISYSLSAFAFACAADMRPLSGNIL